MTQLLLTTVAVLSRHRVVALAVPAIGGMVTLATSAIYLRPTAGSCHVTQGKELFVRRCISCHSLQEEEGNRPAANLSRIGAVAGKRVPRMSAERYLLESILEPDAYRPPGQFGVMPMMVAGEPPEAIRGLVAFLMTHGGEPNYRQIEALKFDLPGAYGASQVDLEAVELGKSLFLHQGKCAECHAMPGESRRNLLAPDLFAGVHEPEHLKQSIREPSKLITPGYEMWIVSLNSGKTYTGRMLRQDKETITLMTREANRTENLTIDRKDISQDEDGALVLRQAEQSTMPVNPDLSDSEIDLIVAYLQAKSQ